MLSFSIPCPDGSGSNDYFNFSVEERLLMFAGSRYRSIDSQVCNDLVSVFGSLGFSFVTGCARGVDESFRNSLATSDYVDKTLVACAFQSRVDRFKGIYPLYVVPHNLPPRAALAKRTLWMTNRCSLLILFPSSPIGKGSSLAFKSAIMGNKPVFVMTDTRPGHSELYNVFPSNLFGIIDGYWCLPHVYQTTGLCYEIT